MRQRKKTCSIHNVVHVKDCAMNLIMNVRYQRGGILLCVRSMTATRRGPAVQRKARLAGQLFRFLLGVDNQVESEIYGTGELEGAQRDRRI